MLPTVRHRRFSFRLWWQTQKSWAKTVGSRQVGYSQDRGYVIPTQKKKIKPQYMRLSDINYLCFKKMI